MSWQPKQVATAGAEPVSLHTRAIARLWLWMVDHYGHRWTSQYGTDPVGGAAKAWADALEGLTPTQLRCGIDACAACPNEWPPNLPAFKALCLGIPDLESVAADLTKPNARRQPFTLLVWQHLDTWAFRHADHRGARALLREAYDRAAEHRMRGGELPVPPPELTAEPPPAPKRADPAVVAAAMAAAREALGVVHADPEQPVDG
jgi:hypothetical protein